MKTTSYHLASLERLARTPVQLPGAIKAAPAAARRTYDRQLEFLAACYGLTTIQLERLIMTRMLPAY